ncbi:efflux RND transporter periplasmic adaptor subunit [Massilia sp. TS11]|uniref:efflux RND transporter periplasmic adaptor subunit n=1 Tax=Massilia sp. TS11 TaxID=2908003 RepID=UPI001EDBFC67|nr:efflux RND transporter periplasmic adaptor subunit [Massilia sp. TS11]MCG2583674.1 efflux RND transporter periplasmic adaptor subunit [Massilia sp. TS11]
MTLHTLPLMRRWQLGAAAAAVAVAVAVLAGRGSHAADNAAAASQRPALTVSTARPQRERLPQRLSATGNVMAWQEAAVGSEANGLRLAEVKVNVGDVVKKGQVLAVFADEVVKAELAQARASLLEAQALAAEAAANGARARQLQGSGALSAQQLNQLLTAEQTAAARVEAAKAAVASSELRLKQATVRAPDDGIISARPATVGAVLPTGSELFRMVRQSRLEWRAEVTAAELARLSAGTSAEVTAADGSKTSGKLRVIGPTIDAQTRNALVYVDLPARAFPAFKPGMFASGQFLLGESEGLTVPQQAVVLRDGFSYVFRVNADKKVSQLKVQVGRRHGERIEILSGLPAEAEVVAQGAGFLKDSDLVRVANAK